MPFEAAVRGSLVRGRSGLGSAFAAVNSRAGPFLPIFEKQSARRSRACDDRRRPLRGPIASHSPKAAEQKRRPRISVQESSAKEIHDCADANRHDKGALDAPQQSHGK
jgi:hypothetical protein